LSTTSLVNPDRHDQVLSVSVPGSVLIVDDDPTQRMLLRYTCEHLGVQRIEEAGDGFAALDAMSRGRFDLILLDVMMPAMDGVETCRRLRRDWRQEDVAILVQTALNDPVMRRTCFEAGATDFVTKPIDVAEVSARVRVHLENRALMRELRDFRTRMDVHLSLIGEHVRNVMPSAADIARLADRKRLSVDVFHRPSEEVGGDFWTIRGADDDRAVILLVDAVGHGLAATINALRIDAALRGFPPLSTPAILTALDRHLSMLEDGGLTAAVTAVDYDAAAGTAIICAAGAPTPLLCRRGRVSPIATGGLPVGTGLFSARAETLTLAPGDAIVLYSDGWVDGDPERAADIVGREIACDRPLSAERLAAQGIGGPHDDLTLLVISRRVT
jgi:sigma-B regulation protein RsbU (phosphoserine phosphatase)